jgi:uncharacterized membrane protein YedE/YeeE
MRTLRSKGWSPYAVGAGIGLLSWIAFATVDRGLGITTPFEHTAALLHGSAEYLAEHKPKIDWEWMLVVGVFFGSWWSSRSSGDRNHDTVPPAWRARFGDSVALRLVFAFTGGVVMMLGARLALGCTSGHGITGALQLAVSSWIFVALAFGAAIATALLLYGRPRSTGGE